MSLVKRPSFAALVLFLSVICILVAATSRSHAARVTPPPAGTCVTGTIAGYPSVSCLNKTWHCSSLQRSTQVHVVIKDAPSKLDAVHVDSGCTGRFRVAIQTDSGDGIKLHAGAHDLQIWGGPIRTAEDHSNAAIICTGKYGQVHQDGVQAMGGDRINLMYFKIWCPSGNNGGIFFAGGLGGSIPHYVQCWWCDLMEANAAFHISARSVGSGVRFSKLHTARTKSSPPNCRRIDHDAVDPVDIDNTCLTPK